MCLSVNHHQVATITTHTHPQSYFLLFPNVWLRDVQSIHPGPCCSSHNVLFTAIFSIKRGLFCFSKPISLEVPGSAVVQSTISRERLANGVTCGCFKLGLACLINGLKCGCYSCAALSTTPRKFNCPHLFLLKMKCLTWTKVYRDMAGKDVYFGGTWQEMWETRNQSM